MIFATRPYRAHTTPEFAGRLGIAARTVRNYPTELSVSGRLPIVKEEMRRRLAPTRRSRRHPSASFSRRRPRPRPGHPHHVRAATGRRSAELARAELGHLHLRPRGR